MFLEENEKMANSEIVWTRAAETCDIGRERTDKVISRVALRLKLKKSIPYHRPADAAHTAGVTNQIGKDGWKINKGRSKRKGWKYTCSAYKKKNIHTHT